MIFQLVVGILLKFAFSEAHQDILLYNGNESTPLHHGHIIGTLSTSPLTLSYVASAQGFTVPDNVDTLTVTLYGAAGGSYSLPGGQGGVISSTFPVTAGEVLYIYTGGQGQTGASAGFNGGGVGSNYGSSGGGATDIRRSPYGLANRLVVAGGGGGTSANGGSYGGYGGYPVGGDAPPAGGGQTGKGGTQTVVALLVLMEASPPTPAYLALVAMARVVIHSVVEAVGATTAAAGLGMVAAAGAPATRQLPSSLPPTAATLATATRCLSGRWDLPLPPRQLPPLRPPLCLLLPTNRPSATRVLHRILLYPTASPSLRSSRRGPGEAQRWEDIQAVMVVPSLRSFPSTGVMCWRYTLAVKEHQTGPVSMVVALVLEAAPLSEAAVVLRMLGYHLILSSIV